ncbi:class I SAM-dependent methyltransferase [Patescibacteria group bacterium]|nr:class I SAM-dependent methyltransferase [Patescibacteria group bacterium]MBU4099228.1 class I SAM-dependent methyltransferase [Patescibacteria group bacterium]
MPNKEQILLHPVEPAKKYFEGEQKSIWGKESKDFLKFIKTAKLHGFILNGGAGDGRYNNELLERADRVIAADVDPNPLQKLCKNTPPEYKQKLELNVFDITKKFPYKNNSFDGFFSTGLLHIFPKEVFENISHEIHRVVKPGGKVILGFSTDMIRTKKDGELHIYKGEPEYSLSEGEKLLKKTFKNEDFNIIKMLRSHSSENNFRRSDPPYKLDSNYIYLLAKKKQLRPPLPHSIRPVITPLFPLATPGVDLPWNIGISPSPTTRAPSPKPPSHPSQTPLK